MGDISYDLATIHNLLDVIDQIILPDFKRDLTGSPVDKELKIVRETFLFVKKNVSLLNDIKIIKDLISKAESLSKAIPKNWDGIRKRIDEIFDATQSKEEKEKIRTKFRDRNDLIDERIMAIDGMRQGLVGKLQKILYYAENIKSEKAAIRALSPEEDEARMSFSDMVRELHR